MNTARALGIHLLFVAQYLATVGWLGLAVWFVVRTVYTFGLDRPGVPEFTTVLWMLCVGAGFVYALVILLYLAAPSRMLARRNAKTRIVRVARNNRIRQLVEQMSCDFGVAPPRLYIAPGQTCAFVMQGAGRSVLVLGDCLLAAMPAAGVRWLLAHELAHLSTGDPRNGRLLYVVGMVTLWLSSLLTSFERLAWGITGVLLPLRLLMPVFRLYANLGLRAQIAARRVHQVFDRWAGRSNERRADAAATEYAGADAGRVALSAYHSGQFWTGLMDTHPSMRSRKKRIRRQIRSGS